MQIASFILIKDRTLHQLENQLEEVMSQLTSPGTVFLNLVSMRLHELGDEHPISIPFSSLHPLDQAAQRQHEHILSTFEDPRRPSRLRQMAETVGAPLYYVSPGRVHEFVKELEHLHLTNQVQPQDVEGLLGKRVSREELPNVTGLLEQFRHDLYQVYRDAADEGMGVVVLVVNQPDEITDEDTFPQAA